MNIVLLRVIPFFCFRFRHFHTQLHMCYFCQPYYPKRVYLMSFHVILCTHPLHTFRFLGSNTVLKTFSRTPSSSRASTSTTPAVLSNYTSYQTDCTPRGDLVVLTSPVAMNKLRDVSRWIWVTLRKRVMPCT